MPGFKTIIHQEILCGYTQEEVLMVSHHNTTMLEKI